MSANAQTIELLLFEVAGVRYGAELSQVRAIAAPEQALLAAPALGTPAQGRRALVFDAPGLGPRHLAVDKVLGVRAVDVLDLRRMPATIATPPPTIGAWIDKDLAVLLVDLHAVPASPESP